MKKLVRFQHGQTTAYGTIEGESVQPIEGDLFGALKASGAAVPLSEVKLLYPVKASKIFCVGLNYKSHLGGRPAPTQPEIFYKPITALQNPGDPIITPAQSSNMHFEGELVAVISKRCRNISAADASGAVLGVTCGNDISERDWQDGPAGSFDFLIDQPPGRYLFLRLRLVGCGAATPVVRQVRLDFPRVTSLELLPPVYRGTPDTVHRDS